MIKIINPAGWNWDRPVAQMIKMSSRGLTGTDRRDFIKLAGTTAPAFLNQIDNVKFAKDEVPIHLLAMGASEKWGCNRNFDAFQEHELKAHHHTFEKFAKFFRNHDNKNHSPSYGVVKKSAYNDAMHRVELLVGLNAEKSAADRNGGFVADKELKKLASGEDIGVSMATRVPHDVCANCGHKARTRDDYCLKEACIGPHGEKRGGCRNNLGKMYDDGHVQHVLNPSPSFFDISHVFRPADRTAYGTKADWLDKAASATEFVGGAELADALGITAPLNVCLSQDEPWNWTTAIRGQVKLAHALAILENNDNWQIGKTAMQSLHPSLQSPVSDDQLNLLGHPGTMKSAEAMGALADKKVLLTIDDFARWTGRGHLTKSASQLLPGVYRRLASRNDLADIVSANSYACAEKTAGIAQRALAGNMMSTHSMAIDAVRDRAMRGSIRQLPSVNLKTGFVIEKTASDSPDATALAEEYGLYKLAALYRIASFDHEFHLTASLAVGQNRIW